MPNQQGMVLSVDTKRRLKWTRQLHEQFVEAVSELGGAESKLSVLIPLFLGSHMQYAHQYAVKRKVVGIRVCKEHIVQVYFYHGGNDVRQNFEIDAHIGGVNDIAFSTPKKQLCIVTCGDDKLIKVWDATSGAKQYTFEGHETPVYFVCPHHKENIQFMFSTALDGKIKAWLYDNVGSRVDYDAPGHWYTTMAYSVDGSRLSCGTSKEAESHIAEWNETEGAVKRAYQGFRKRSLDVVQFDIIRNRFLAGGDDFFIKFWDMDNTNLLITTDADGSLPASPKIRFN